MALFEGCCHAELQATWAKLVFVKRSWMLFLLSRHKLAELLRCLLCYAVWNVPDKEHGGTTLCRVSCQQLETCLQVGCCRWQHRLWIKRLPPHTYEQSVTPTAVYDARAHYDFRPHYISSWYHVNHTELGPSEENGSYICLISISQGSNWNVFSIMSGKMNCKMFPKLCHSPFNL